MISDEKGGKDMSSKLHMQWTIEEAIHGYFSIKLKYNNTNLHHQPLVIIFSLLKI